MGHEKVFELLASSFMIQIKFVVEIFTNIGGPGEKVVVSGKVDMGNRGKASPFMAVTTLKDKSMSEGLYNP